MKKEHLEIIGSIVIVGLLVIGAIAIARIFAERPLGGIASISEPSCQIAQTKVAIGNQLATTIIGTSTSRAWLQVSYPIATSTAWLSLGGTATTNNGYPIGQSVGSTTRISIEVGRRTSNPFIGPISAITDSGSTTVLVNECSYQ